LTVCTRVGNSLQLLDPATLQTCEIPPQVYWRTPFDSLATVTDLVEFTILDIEPDFSRQKGKWVMADAQVAVSGAFKSNRKDSNNDDVMDYDGVGSASMIFHTRTHLGAILQPGDAAMGYHLTSANYNSDSYAEVPQGRIPDVILVKKAYPNRRKKSKARNWKLRSMAKEADEEGATGAARGAIGRMGGRDSKKVEEDYEIFLRELEEDPDLRANVNLYKAADVKMDTTEPEKPVGGKKKKVQYAMDVDEKSEATDEEAEEAEPDFPEVRIDELLEEFDEMTLGGGGDGGDGGFIEDQP
jgi:nonsense-mediated mRNA decay protein 3